ncbi:RnfABCDGE type electron transport complex subunit D [Salidesulfovibrio onnuriiensis]|uniref:RnfABCDGE type electron transport complex subunit D n=1 Tax=Salidesulfovibrio onnuriiensis TaxID=2583823 RepID=UPI0011C887B3|nr:RnfABCDGE type electron transport complex subunit D [Salidesulfovibrio onnuriiensis]
MRPIEPLLTVSVPPHAHCGKTVQGHMRDILIALLPAAIASAVFFGLDAVRVMALSCSVAVLVETACWKLQKKEPQVDDLHALVVGLLFAFLLAPSAPWWLVVMGSTASIIGGKMFFGGLGGYPLCPPLVGWAVCRISWGPEMDTNATMLASNLPAPLHELKHFGLAWLQGVDMTDLLLGHQLGGLGAVQILPLLAGGIYLLARKTIRPTVPLSFLAGVYLTALIYRLLDPSIYAPAHFHLIAGSAVLGAFFLATEGPTTPMGLIPAILFGLLSGAMVIIIRVYGMYPDGVPFAILLLNLFTPMLDRIRPKPFGGARAGTPYTGGC